MREDTFSGNKNEDAHDHVDRLLNIVSLFNIPRVSHDAVLLRMFPFTLTGSAKRWVDRLTPGAVNTWDLLKKPLSKGIVHHLRPLNDLKTSTTSSRKAMNHYTKIGNGPYLDKECTLNEEVNQVEKVKYGEFRRPTPFNGSNGAKFRVGPSGYYTCTNNRPPYGEKRLSLEKLMNKHQEESARKSAQMDEWIKKLQENAEINTRN
ncbi:hypothetical protein Tco_0648735 [Tanacetum coccineum]